MNESKSLLPDAPTNLALRAVAEARMALMGDRDDTRLFLSGIEALNHLAAYLIAIRDLERTAE